MAYSQPVLLLSSEHLPVMSNQQDWTPRTKYTMLGTVRSEIILLAFLALPLSAQVRNIEITFRPVLLIVLEIYSSRMNS